MNLEVVEEKEENISPKEGNEEYHDQVLEDLLNNH
jgi:hypothetical protein